MYYTPSFWTPEDDGISEVKTIEMPVVAYSLNDFTKPVVGRSLYNYSLTDKADKSENIQFCIGIEYAINHIKSGRLVCRFLCGLCLFLGYALDVIQD